MSVWKELERFLGNRKETGKEDCRKIFHGPGGALPGLEFLIIDKMASLVFVITYRSLSSEDLSELVTMLSRHCPDSFLRVQERGRGLSKDLFQSKDMPEKIILKEGGVSFYIHPARGQNLGFFPDMVNGRSYLKSYISDHAPHGKVLNLFSYTCAFSIVSLQAGASRVDNWDMNRNSLKIGMLNHELNNLNDRSRKVQYFAHDIFKSFGKLRKNGPYDLIVMDPPPHQGSSFTYEKDYPKLIRRVGEWLNEGGACLFCLNAPDCGWQDFGRMIKEALPGDFTNWEEVQPPEEFTGRYPERGVKCYFLTGWRVKNKP